MSIADFKSNDLKNMPLAVRMAVAGTQIDWRPADTELALSCNDCEERMKLFVQLTGWTKDAEISLVRILRNPTADSLNTKSDSLPSLLEAIESIWWVLQEMSEAIDQWLATLQDSGHQQFEYLADYQQCKSEVRRRVQQFKIENSIHEPPTPAELADVLRILR